MYTFLTAEGIGDTQNTMLSQVAKHLDPDLFVVKRLAWRSQYGPVPRLDGLSFDRNVTDAVQLGADMIRADRNIVVLGGYSGGAAVMRKLASKIMLGVDGYTDLQIAGLANIADPFRPQGLGIRNGSWGIAGQIPIDGLPQWDASDPNDVICCCPADSPLRTFADGTSSFSFADPLAWAKNLQWRLTARKFQAVVVNWPNLDSVRAQFARAQYDFDGYRNRGDHTEYAIRVKPGTSLTYTTWLASELNAFAGADA